VPVLLLASYYLFDKYTSLSDNWRNKTSLNMIKI